MLVNGKLNVSEALTFSGGTSTVTGSGAINTTRLHNQNFGTSNLNGVRINIGTGGITLDNGTLNLGATTLGATANWSSSAAMALTNTTTGTTINTRDSVDNTTGRTVSLSGALSGVGNLVKTGAGTLGLSGTNTYTGTTTVSEGTLAVNGSLTSTTTVQNSGILQGSGRTTGSVTVQSGGTFAPGNSIESFGLGTLSMEAGSTFAFELDSASLNGDLAYSSDDLNIASGSILTMFEISAGTLANGDKLTLISYAGGWNGGLFNYNGSELADNSTFTLGSNEWRFNYADTSGGSNFTADQAGASNFVTMTVIPEPSIVTLFGGFGAMLMLRRRRVA